MQNRLDLRVFFKVVATYEDGSEETLETFDNYASAELYIVDDMPYSGGEFWIKKVWIPVVSA